MKIKQNEELNIKPEQIKPDPAGLPFSLDDFPKDQKGRAILPDEIFMEYLKQLPNDTRSESGLIAYNGGLLKSYGSGALTPEEELARRRAGKEAQTAVYWQRRSIADSIEMMLTQKADPEQVEQYGLKHGATKQDVMVAAILQQATSGNVKAFTSLRDTVGEMPTIKQEVTADILTAEDRELLEKIRSRQQAERRNDRKTVQNPADNPEANS